MPMRAEPASRMIVRTSAKSRLTRPGTVIRSVMPCTPWRRTSSAMRNASTTEVSLLDDLEQPVVRDDDQRVHLLLEVRDPDLRLLGALAALERERARDDPDGERADLAGDLGHDGRAARAGAAALAGGDEDHVRALERLLDLVAALPARPPADLGIRAGAETARRGWRRCGASRSASHMSSACASVFTAMNSTPLSPASTIRLTAFDPPPPMPTTLITARYVPV